MIQPEEILIDILGKSGIEAWSSLDDLDSVNEVVFLNRVSAFIDQQALGLGWQETVYSIDLQCYSSGSQLDAYELVDRVRAILTIAYDKDVRADLGILSIGWLPPLSDKSGASLGIQLTITQGDYYGN